MIEIDAAAPHSLILSSHIATQLHTTTTNTINNNDDCHDVSSSNREQDAQQLHHL